VALRLTRQPQLRRVNPLFIEHGPWLAFHSSKYQHCPAHGSSHLPSQSDYQLILRPLVGRHNVHLLTLVCPHLAPRDPRPLGGKSNGCLVNCLPAPIACSKQRSDQAVSARPAVLGRIVNEFPAADRVREAVMTRRLVQKQTPNGFGGLCCITICITSFLSDLVLE
jgi:hypothetical protein